MATQIFESEQSVLLHRQAEAAQELDQAESESRGGAFRGFIYAMLFNAILLALGVGAWELWRYIR
jgi:hypothetical protein